MERILGNGELLGGRQISREVLKLDIDALLIDLDGTVYTDSGPIPGALAALESLRDRGVPFRFVTNTTRAPRRKVVERLLEYGIEVNNEDLFTAVTAAASRLRALGVKTIAPFLEEETLEDLDGFSFSGGVSSTAGQPDAVLLGDLGNRWTVDMLNEAFRYVMDGAQLVALQKNKYWQDGGQLAMDAGPFVVAVEFATGRAAEICGKPDKLFFKAAQSALGLAGSAEHVGSIAMIGDDLLGDIKGAQDVDMQGWLVMTGKFREKDLSSSVVPDRVLSSLADLIDLL